MTRHRRLNRARVIARAAALADEAGDARAVSLAALAAALDVRPPSLYNHVASLDDLLDGVALHGLQALLAELRDATAGLIGREAVLAMAAAYRRFARVHPGIYPLTLRAPTPDNAAARKISEELVQLLRLVLASLGLAGEDAIHAIRGLRALLHGFVSLEAAAGFRLPLDVDASFDRLLTAFLDGLKGAPS